MTNVKLGQLINAEHGLAQLSKFDLPLQTARQLKKLKAAVAEEVKFYHEAREKLISSLGAYRDPRPEELPMMANPTEQILAVTDENMPEFLARMKDLMEMDIELSVAPLKLDTLGDVRISANQLELLEAVTED